MNINIKYIHNSYLSSLNFEVILFNTYNLLGIYCNYFTMACFFKSFLIKGMT